MALKEKLLEFAETTHGSIVITVLILFIIIGITYVLEGLFL